MNANERIILEMIIQRAEYGESIKGLVSLLHEQTAEALPRNTENRQEIIQACHKLLNGELPNEHPIL